jgi:hypothetical protein
MKLNALKKLTRNIQRLASDESGLKKTTLFVFLCFITISSVVATFGSSNIYKNSQTITHRIDRSSQWQTYNIPEEGNYILKLSTGKNSPNELNNKLEIYIPDNSLVSQPLNQDRSVFIPSTGETLNKVNLEDLTNEQGYSVSLRAHSFVYFVSDRSNKDLDLNVIKVGPAKPLVTTN